MSKSKVREIKNKWKWSQRLLRLYRQYKFEKSMTKVSYGGLAAIFGLIMPMIIFLFEKPHFSFEGKGINLAISFILSAFFIGFCLGKIDSGWQHWQGEVKR